MKRPYIVGSISDGGTVPMEERPARIAKFNEAEAALREAGMDPINPARHEGQHETWLDYMRSGLHDLADSDGICALDGHEKSVGAMAEIRTARDIGLPVANLDSWIEFKGNFQ